MVQTPGERQGRNEPAANAPRMRDGGGKVTASGCRIAAVKADHGGDAQFPTGYGGFFQAFGYERYLGNRVVPPSGFKQQVADDAVRLGLPDRGARLVREPL